LWWVKGDFFGRYAGTDREYYSYFSVMLALCLHNHKDEHIAPIMFPPFSLDPIGFGVVGPMGPFFLLLISHCTAKNNSIDGNHRNGKWYMPEVQFSMNNLTI
jgi:hypothetical protein